MFNFYAWKVNHFWLRMIIHTKFFTFNMQIPYISVKYSTKGGGGLNPVQLVLNDVKHLANSGSLQ